jgi:hypothetical protein
MVARFGLLPGSVASPCLNFIQMGAGGSRAPLDPASDTPPLRKLSFIHKLQTEMSSKMNALKQGLDAEPPFPQGFPAGRPITSASQIASQLCDGLTSGSRRHPCRRLTRLCGNNGKQIGFDGLVSRTLRFPSGKVSQVQQTHGQCRQQPQQPYQALSALDLALFQPASRFERLQILLHDPAVLIPPDALGILARASSWRPRSTESTPTALLRRESALPRPESPTRFRGGALVRFSPRGGKMVWVPKASCTTVERAVRP